jgi:hypothetical protein
MLLRILTATGWRSLPPREAMDIIRDLSAQGVTATQIAANLNMLEIPAGKEKMWTEDAVNTELILLSVSR